MGQWVEKQECKKTNSHVGSGWASNQDQGKKVKKVAMEKEKSGWYGKEKLGNVGDKDEPDCTSESGDKELNYINPFKIKFKEVERGAEKK